MQEEKQQAEIERQRIPEDKVCRDCGVVLTHDNITQQRIGSYNWRCTTCINTQMDELRGNYRFASEKEHYKIVRSMKKSCPRITSVDYDKFGSNYEMLKDFIKETDQYRVDKMLRIVLSDKLDAKDRKAAVNYLLQCIDKLTKEQCLYMFNAIHRLMADTKASADVKVKLSNELQAFSGDAKTTKEQGMRSYEQALSEGDDIEVGD